MTLFDTLLSQDSSRARVVSEQHDASKINWVGGVTDPGEMIGCGRYQELRRLAGEADETYQQRLERLLPTLPAADREKIEASMTVAALARAGLDTSNGRVCVMVAGLPPWHRLGVNVEQAVDSAEAMKLAGLDWEVGKTPFFYYHNGEIRQQKEQFAIVRKDTGAMLGSVGSRYAPIQNVQGFEFLDCVLGSFGAKYESAGAVYDGRRVWMLVVLPRQAFNVNGSDEVKAYALFTNPHDGSGVAECFPTSERVVCANTLRVARSEQDHGLKIRHTGDVKAKVKAAQEALGMAVQSFADFKTNAERLAATPMPDFAGFANRTLDQVFELTAEAAAQGPEMLAKLLALPNQIDTIAAEKKFATAIEKRQDWLNDILERYETEQNGTAGMRGTAWAGLNAVTSFADHSTVIRYKGSDHAKASRRMESSLSGDGDELKQAAFAQAMALAN